MKRIGVITALLFLVLTGAITAMATEEAPYTVIKTDGIFELREYAPQVLAEIMVDGELEDAGNKAFRPLFRYISGDNQSQSKIAMTAPVSQEQQGEKIAMTAPVSQQRVQGKWAVSFMMPAAYTLATLPTPMTRTSRCGRFRPAGWPPCAIPVLWSEEKYLLHKEKLEKWITDNRFTVSGEPIWARYNSPFTLWFLRRNEVLIPVTVPAP